MIKNKIKFQDIEVYEIELSEVEYENIEIRSDTINDLLHCASSHKRVLVRPKINIYTTILNVLIPLLVASLIGILIHILSKNVYLDIFIPIAILFIYIVLRLKAIMIWFIRLYQAVAPDRIRLRCVFTPSCSEYAIEALNKFGVIKAIPKIISRLKRCHYPNGGYDPVQ